jgi:glycerophosphoryl diester phosphodiesterase
VSQKVLKIGHRGGAGHAPENTLAAIRRSIAFRVDYVELDVQRTRDGSLVLMHDKTVDRTTNGSGFVRELTYSQIRGLDAGDEERVPSLREVLSISTRRIGLVLETITPGIGPELCEDVTNLAFDGPVIFASFHHADILAIRKIDPSANTMALLEGVPVTGASFATEARANFVGLSIDSVTSGFIATLHDAGLKVLVYTVNEPLMISTAKKLGVDGIISDFPDRI